MSLPAGIERLIVEVEKSYAPLKLYNLDMDCASSNFECREQVQNSMSFLCAFRSLNYLPTVRFHLTGGTLQRLYVGFFINRYNQFQCGQNLIAKLNVTFRRLAGGH
jgi:hypothetical protein